MKGCYEVRVLVIMTEVCVVYNWIVLCEFVTLYHDLFNVAYVL